MTGGESLFRTLFAGGVEVCFTTSRLAEAPFAAQFARARGIRFVAGLDEGTVAGAANGYARMADRPAATLLHAGPGLAEAASGLGNAASSGLPVVNLIIAPGPAAGRRRGERASAPAIEEIARPYSGWLRVSTRPGVLGRDAADALLAARIAPGRVASLIVPEEFFNAEGGRQAAVFEPPRAPMPGAKSVARVAALLRRRAPAALLLGASASCGEAQITAGRVAAATGARLLASAEARRVCHGAGLAAIERLPAGSEAARLCLDRFRLLVLAGVPAPDPGGPMEPGLSGPVRTVETVVLARPEEDACGALEALVVALAAHATAPHLESGQRPPAGSGPITRAGIAAVIGSLLPHRAVVADEAATAGPEIFAECCGAPAHDWIMGPDGAGTALGAGAAIACRERPILCLVGTAGGAPAPPSLWTLAHERQCVTVLRFIGRANTAGEAIAHAREVGVPGRRVETLEALAEALCQGFASGGPSLIEVSL